MMSSSYSVLNTYCAAMKAFAAMFVALAMLVLLAPMAGFAAQNENGTSTRRTSPGSSEDGSSPSATETTSRASSNERGAETAQDSRVRNGDEEPTGSRSNRSQFDLKNGVSDDESYIILTGPRGEAVPLPLNATVEEFLDWLDRRNQRDQQESPDFNLTSVTLEGTAEDERVLLTARLQVQVHREDQWVRVPLRLNEAILRETDYRGVGEASFDGLERDAGYQWWFKGKGLHELTLSLVVPIRKQITSRRLQLAIPPTAVSSLKLHVPLERISVTPPERTALKTRSLGENGSELELYGLGTRLDLSWQPLPDLSQVETVLQSVTSMSAELTSESVLLEVKQRVQALQGSFQEVEIRLPRHFELIDVKGEHYANHEFDPDDERLLVVELNEPTTGPVELRFTLETEFPQQGGQLTLEGFEVAHARRQTGEIAIHALEGYRIAKREGEDQSVHRINVSEFVGQGGVGSAYRFLQQPFRLVLDVQEIEPYFTIEPHLFTRMSEERIDLEATFRVQVYRGTVQEFELTWPGWKEEGWSLEPADSPGLVEQAILDQGGDDDTLRIRLVRRANGIFDIPLKASRPIRADDEESRKEIRFTLPRMDGSSRLPAVLIVADADNVESDLIPQRGTITRPLPLQRREKINIPEEYRDLRRTEFQIDSASLAFSATVTPQEQTIRTDTTATVELQEQRLLITQRISYEVAYERIPQVRLLVPPEFQDRIRFSLGDETQLTPNWTGLTVGSLKQVRFMLSEPQIGRFDIVARFILDLPDEPAPTEDLAVSLPLVQSADADFNTVQFEFERSGQTEIAVDDASWRPQLSMDYSSVWIANGPQADVPLRLTHSSVHPSQDYSIHKSLIRTVFDAEGRARSRGQYRIGGDVSTLVITFPADIVPEGFWWNQQALEPDRIAEPSDNRREYHLPIAAELAQGDHLLTVDFRTESSDPFAWTNQHSLSKPLFPANVWIDQTVWEVTLPFDQHLFNPPRGYTPQYRWQRQIVFWSRQARSEYDQLTEWIQADDGPEDRIDFSHGNTYQFSRFGPSRSIVFSSMSQPIVVLFGAGLALGLGFVLLKIPQTRNILTVLVLAFLIAVAGLWYSAAIQVLLQPAILGLLLAIAAAMIDNFAKRKRESMILTLSSPSDLMNSSSSSGSSLEQRAEVVGISSDDVTQIRRTTGSSVSQHVSVGESERRA